MALPTGGPAFITFGCAAIGGALAAFALTHPAFPCNHFIPKRLRYVRMHGMTVIIITIPFFIWSIFLNMNSFDSGVVIFPLAALAATVQLCRPSWPWARWVTLAGSCLPAIAYLVGMGVAGTLSPPPVVLIMYFAVAAVTWSFLAVIGYCLVASVTTEGDADPLVPPSSR